LRERGDRKGEKSIIEMSGSEESKREKDYRWQKKE